MSENLDPFHKCGAVQNLGLAPAVTKQDHHPQVIIYYSFYLALWEEETTGVVLACQTHAIVMIPNREDSIVFILGAYVHGISARRMHAD